jgi:ribonuclease T1
MRAALAALLVVSSAALALSGSVRLDQLPREARETLALIQAGGPYPYARDGAVFSNRERQLPARSRGYYREYTVKAPGIRGRGPRRIIAGRGGEYYYSGDHYRTFRRIIVQ